MGQHGRDLEEEEELQEEACLFSNSGISDSLDFRLLQRKCWGDRGALHSENQGVISIS